MLHAAKQHHRNKKINLKKDEGFPAAHNSVLLDVSFTAEAPIYLFINIIHP